jgi:hypothetical protein
LAFPITSIIVWTAFAIASIHIQRRHAGSNNAPLVGGWYDKQTVIIGIFLARRVQIIRTWQ